MIFPDLAAASFESGATFVSGVVGLVGFNLLIIVGGFVSLVLFLLLAVLLYHELFHVLVVPAENDLREERGLESTVVRRIVARCIGSLASTFKALLVI